MNEWRSTLANALVVTVVAVLLWFWAAGQTRESVPIQMQVRFEPTPESGLVATPDTAIPIDVELQGARRALDRAIDALSGRTIVLKTGRGVPSTAGSHLIDLANALARAPEFETRSVAIADVKPPSVPIDLLELVTVDATIEPQMPGAQLVGDAVVEPAMTKMTLPKTLADSLGGSYRVEAYLPAEQVATLEPLRRQNIEVSLRLPEALESRKALIRLQPDRAMLQFTIRSRSRSALLDLVPVQVAGPAADLDNYEITISPGSEFLRDVEVSGPSETIRQLEDGRAKAFAFVHLSADDLALRVTRKRIDMWRLPKGVTVTRIGESMDTEPFVQLSIAPRSTAGP